MGDLDDYKYTKLKALVGIIKDFENPNSDHTQARDMLDDNPGGINVLFSDDSEDDENDLDEVRDNASDDGTGVDTDKELVLRSNYNNESEERYADNEEQLEPRSIDAYWLQRQLNDFYHEPNIALKRSEEVYMLQIL